MLDKVGEVNYPAIIAAAGLYLTIGILWYSPALFGDIWKSLSKTGEQNKPANSHLHMFAEYTYTYFTALLFSFVMAHFVKWTHLANSWEGACLGFWAWLGFIIPTLLGAVIWEKRPFKLFLIEAGYLGLVSVVVGAVLAVWR
jgi:hypothetical protein